MINIRCCRWFTLYLVALYGCDPLQVEGPVCGGGWMPLGAIARWDGGSWSTVEAPVDGQIGFLFVDTVARLAYVTGEVKSSADGVSVGIIQWDMTLNDWTPLPGSRRGAAFYSLVPYGKEIYAGGVALQSVRNANGSGVTSTGLIRWKDSVWEDVEGFLGGRVNMMVLDGNDLYVGGKFEAINNVRNLGRFDLLTRTWEPVGAPDDEVNDLILLKDRLYVSGFFHTIGGITSHYIASFDLNQKTWVSFPGLDAPWTTNFGVVTTMLVHNGDLYIQGKFVVLGYGIASFAKWNSTAGAFTAIADAPDEITGMASDGTSIYLAGQFSTLPGVARANNITRYNPSNGTWHQVGGGVCSTDTYIESSTIYSQINAMAFIGEMLYVSGHFNGTDRQ